MAAEELAQAGVEARAYPTDVAQSAQVDEAFAGVVNDFGRLDIVVNNAGISRVGPHTQDVTDEDWHDSIAVMQTGVFYCMRAAGRIMVPQKSGSCDQHLVDPRLLAQPRPHDLQHAQGRGDHDDEHGCRGVGAARRPRERDRPGVLRTPMWDADVARGAIDEQFYVDTVPMHRLGLPWEVGKLVVFLCSDDAAYITGSVHTIDGALTSIPAG